jgi:hypothetical protein
VRSLLLKRIKLVEQRQELAKPTLIQYGWIKRLPKDYVGERHTVVVKRTATGSPKFEWCRFEERPGPAPPDLDESNGAVPLTPQEQTWTSPRTSGTELGLR